jgi:hypothetical protein
MSESAVQTLWATSKTQYATLQAAIIAAQAAALAYEQTRAALIAQGGNGPGVALWLLTQAKNLGLGWIPYSGGAFTNSLGGTLLISVVAPDPTRVQDLTLLGDVRPIYAVADLGLS